MVKIKVDMRAVRGRLRTAVGVTVPLLYGGCCCDGCCKCCEGGAAPAAWRAPPESVAVSTVAAALATHAVIATTMCGVSAKGLSDVQLEEAWEPVSLPWGGHFKVVGKAIVEGAEAGKEPVVCSGVVDWTIHSKVEDGEVKDWQLDRLELWEVSTPGVTWSRPSSGGGDWDD